MEEPNLSGGLGGSPAEGNAASAMGNSVVNSRLSVDLKMLEGLNKELNTLNENTKKIKSNFKDLIKNTKDLTAELNKAATAMGKVSGKSSSGYMDMSKGMPSVADMREMQLQSVERILGALGKGGAPGGGAPGGGGGGGKVLGGLQAFANNPYVQAASQFGQAAIGAIDDRVDRNKGYALPADRLSVQLQQQYGMSQMDVMTNLRGPLRSRRLGMGGINELLSMQSRTGINAANQAGSVESIRTLMGYGYSAGDATQYIESMGQADTVNRMFMMTGTSLYGIGGKQKSAQQVNQDLIQRLGLNNREIINAGRQSGSMVRQRLQMAGLDEGAQDLLLQYAESNVSFTEKGGKGFYDPSKKSDRERMGIEGNYATQQEETTRTTVNREEQMYKRQADNYAQMEKNLQAVNKALGAFEDKLSGITGARTSTRGFGQLLSPALGILGAIGGFALGGGPVGAMAGYSVGSGIGNAIGDATGGGAANPGRIAAENPTKKTSNTAGLSQLKPVLREPLAKLMADRPGISIGQGYRSPEQQKKMFLERYYRTDEKTDTYYDGSYWLKKPGVAMAAPPGLSYHEIGLAADLVFATPEDSAYLKANASKYGLDEFSRHGEPWHVQSTAYPASRRNYEEEGATYGTETEPEYKYVPDTTGVITETGPMGQTGSGMDYNAVIKQQLTMSESMASFASQGTGSVLPGTVKKLSKDKDRGTAGKTKVETAPGSYDPTELARMLDRRKFKKEDIWKMLAISWRESRWNPNAYVKDNDDDSYGLFQINMLGDMGPKRAKDFGINDYKELLNPITNTKAARILYGGGNLSHWSVNGNPLGDIPESTIKASKEIAGSLGFPTGDPSDKGYTPTKKINQSSSSPTTIKTGETTNNTFNINPTINVTSTGSVSMDAARLAKEVTKLIDRELKMNMVRNS
ncbi:hypothetical protein EB001_00765 [bacterium]|nr:hypothetical protein [bacterium]